MVSAKLTTPHFDLQRECVHFTLPVYISYSFQCVFRTPLATPSPGTHPNTAGADSAPATATGGSSEAARNSRGVAGSDCDHGGGGDGNGGSGRDGGDGNDNGGDGDDGLAAVAATAAVAAARAATITDKAGCEKMAASTLSLFSSSICKYSSSIFYVPRKEKTKIPKPIVIRLCHNLV
jgi:hypothetical protein